MTFSPITAALMISQTDKIPENLPVKANSCISWVTSVPPLAAPEWLGKVQQNNHVLGRLPDCLSNKRHKGIWY